MKGILFLLAALPVMAAPMTINDSCFGTFTSGPNAGQACNVAVPTRDVYGNLAQFDIQKLVLNQFNGNLLSFSIFTNFGNNGAGLDPFKAGNDWLNMGDVMFTVDGLVKYGIPLQSRVSGENGTNGRKNTDPNKKINPNGAGLTAGTLYQVNNGFASDGLGLLKAKSVITNSDPNAFRPEEFVWLQQSGGSLTSLGAGTVSVSTTGGNPHLRIDVIVPLANLPGFYQDGLNGLGIHFASATCGNDILDGRVMAEVPEPGTIGLLGAGLLAFGVALRRRAKA